MFKRCIPTKSVTFETLDSVLSTPHKHHPSIKDGAPGVLCESRVATGYAADSRSGGTKRASNQLSKRSVMTRGPSRLILLLIPFTNVLSIIPVVFVSSF